MIIRTPQKLIKQLSKLEQEIYQLEQIIKIKNLDINLEQLLQDSFNKKIKDI